jgi:endonuclease/exonuclease/phosphatase (EEP) superfamily protein YafD
MLYKTYTKFAHRAVIARLIRHVIYRIHPERPQPDDALLVLSDSAHQTHFQEHTAVRCCVWNVYQGNEPAYSDFFARYLQEVDIAALQEYSHRAALADFHSNVLGGMSGALGISYYLRTQKKDPVGVALFSRVRPCTHSQLFSHYCEPTGNSKVALLMEYPIAHSSETLLVANIHALNFRLWWAYAHQLRDFARIIIAHKGPKLIVGDFNVWDWTRLLLLKAMQLKLRVREVSFPKGVRSFNGIPLDRVFVFGGDIHNARVVNAAGASDHNMLLFDFTITHTAHPSPPVFAGVA